MTTSKKDNQSLVFFRNYDMYETEGANGTPKIGPSKGLYNGPMDRYKSVKDFLKKKRKKNKHNRTKMALLLAIAFPDAVVGRTYKKDTNDLQDPYESPPNENASDKPSEISSFPYNPVEVNELGLYDGLLPHEDFEDKPVANLDFGIMETHTFSANDGKIKNDE